jgi:hypothetical protein
VLTARHRQLKEQLERDKVIQAALQLGRSEGIETMNSSQIDVGQVINGQIDSDGRGDYEMGTHSDQYPESVDSMLDQALKDPGQAVQLFMDSRVSGSEMSSNGIAAEMLWEEIERQVSEEQSDSEGENWDVVMRGKRVVDRRSEWYPFASREASHAFWVTSAAEEGLALIPDFRMFFSASDWLNDHWPYA